MSETKSTSTSGVQVTGLTFIAAYVDDYASALEFYTGLLGLEVSFEMGPDSAFLKITDEVGLYLEGGNAPVAVTPKSVRASFGLTAASVDATFARLKAAGVRIVHESGPQEMGGGTVWFQCYDPAGNLIEIVGPR